MHMVHTHTCKQNDQTHILKDENRRRGHEVERGILGKRSKGWRESKCIEFMYEIIKE